MWLVFLLLALVIGLLNSTIEANLYKIELKDKKFKIKLILSIKLFGIIKIFYVNFNEYGFKILNKKITYKEIILKAKKENINIYKIDVNFLRTINKQLEIKFKKSYFKLKIGLVDIALTNIVIIIFSSILPIIMKLGKNFENLKYEVFPEYNKFCIFLNGKISVSIKLIKLIKIYFKNIKPEITHNKNKKYEVKESF